MEFVILTRFGLYVNDEEWYREQLRVFKKYALSSLSEQEDLDFHWIVAIDEHAPKDVIESLNSCLEHFPFKSHLVIYKRREDGRTPKIGGTEWIYDEALDKIGRKNIFKHGSDFHITGMIDADDAWHKSTVKKVKSILKDKVEGIERNERHRGYLVSPSGGAVLTFRHGYYYYEDKNKLQPVLKNFQSMSVFVLSRVLSGISCHSSRHLFWAHFDKVVGFEKLIFETERPMWIYTKSKTGKDYNPETSISILNGVGYEELSNFGLTSSEIKENEHRMNFNMNAHTIQENFFNERWSFISTLPHKS